MLEEFLFIFLDIRCIPCLWILKEVLST